MTDNAERRAGSIIFKEITLLNRSATYLEQEIMPALSRQISDEIKTWAHRMEWTHAEDFGHFWEEDLEIWPPSWEVSDEEWRGWIGFGHRTGARSSILPLADLCGVGHGEYGLEFINEHWVFGGKRAWDAYARTLEDEITSLTELGWRHLGSGKFFLPVILSPKDLALAWAGEDWSTALYPLTDALETLGRSVQVFNRIVDNAPIRTLES